MRQLGIEIDVLLSDSGAGNMSVQVESVYGRAGLLQMYIGM